MNNIDIRSKSSTALTQLQYNNLSAFIGKQVKFLSQPSSGHWLNPASQEKLDSRLWQIAVQAINRHDPTKAPLMQFVKTVVKMSMYREAQRLFKEQCDRAEAPWGDDSLDAPVTEGEEDSATLVDFVAADAEVLLRRKRILMVRRTLSRLPWTEQMALETLMYADSRKGKVAEFLGFSRPTLDAFIKNVAAPHFAALWNGQSRFTKR